MNRIMFVDTPNNKDSWVDPKNHMFTIFGDDTYNYKLVWASHPEPIVSLALKNPDIDVCKEEKEVLTQIKQLFNKWKLNIKISYGDTYDFR